MTTKIQTYTGRYVDPFAVKPEDICIEDIAHALSNLCRFTGHTTRFYSVSEHSVRVASKLPREMMLAGLLHDASEAYLNDIAAPVKHRPEFQFYREAEVRALHEIGVTFTGRRTIFFEDFGQVKEADRRMLCTEARDLLRHPDLYATLRGQGVEPYTEHIRPASPQEAERAFLAMFTDLTAEVAAS